MQQSTIPFILVGILFIALGMPLARQKVRPNRWYGFRVPATVNNPDVWYPVNALTGRLMEITGVLTLAAALLAQLLGPGLTEDDRALVPLAVLLVGTLYMTVRGLLLVRDLTR